MFNFTHHELCNTIVDLYNDYLDVRIITDDECAKGKGSDITYMAQQGIPVRTDCSAQYHMHNKFVIVDDQFLITGSFNWTYVAGKHNQENVIVVDNPYYIQKYD